MNTWRRLRIIHFVETDCDGIVLTSPYLKDFNLPAHQEVRFRLNSYENTYNLLKKAVKFPDYHGSLSGVKGIVPSHNLCTFVDDNLYVCFFLKDGLTEDNHQNLLHNIWHRTHHVILKVLAACSLNLPVTSSLNLVHTILHHNFQLEFFGIHTNEISQLSKNLFRESNMRLSIQHYIYVCKIRTEEGI